MTYQQKNLVRKIIDLIEDASDKGRRIVLIKLPHVDFMLICCKNGLGSIIEDNNRIIGIPFEFDEKVFEITLVEG